MSPAPAVGYRRVGYVIGAALFAITLAVFLPSVGHDFVAYDDLGFVTENTWVKAGLTMDNIVHAFRSTEMANWHPLTWISYLVDVQLFGAKPWGFHLTNILLHALNTLVVFVVLRRLTGATWRSAFVAGLFGLHPLHVESVAWIAERKDVLCTLFWFLSIGCYGEWARRRAGSLPRAGRFYALSLLAFAAGLMSKPMVVTLPCVLLLIDYWPLARWSGSPQQGRVAIAVRLLAEKLPFLALSLADCVVTLKAQADIGAVQGLVHFPWPSRVANALITYVTYLGKCFFPADLAVYYPYSEHHALGVTLAAAVVLTMVSVLAVLQVRRRPYVLFGWLWFLGTLVPVIGLVQVGGQAMADRYTYIPLVGIFLVVTWTVTEWTGRLARPRAALVSVSALVLISSAGLTTRQLEYWRDSGTLFRRALAVTKDNVPAHLGLGYYYGKVNKLNDSIAEYREVIRLAPELVEGHLSVAAMLARTPNGLREAIPEYQAALRIRPNDVSVWFALARALEEFPERRAEAIAAYESLLRLAPDNAEAHNRLGNLLADVPGRRAEAIDEYRAALRLRPDWVEVHLNLGATFAEDGRFSDAVAEYETVIRAKPDFAEAHNNLANALGRLPNRAAAAATEYETAIRLRPDYFEAHFNYAVLLGTVLGRRADAVAQLNAVLRIRPGFQPAIQLLAQLQQSPGSR